MARWEPDARGRLEKAAMELFQKNGYARTTVEEIAAHAGLTERTFFRHYADKREVLFSGSHMLQTALVDAVKSAPAGTAPLKVVAHAVEQAGAALQSSRDIGYVRARFALLAEHAELRERELIKLAALATAVAHALHARGVAEPTASMAAEAGIAAFKVGFERWATGLEPSDFPAHIRAAWNALRKLVRHDA